MGTVVWNDGVRYEGVYENGQINKLGVLYFTDGSKYEGEFKDN